MVEILAPDLTPSLPAEAVSAFKATLAKGNVHSGIVYISPGSIHRHIAAIVWTSGDEAAHTVESVELLRTVKGAEQTAQRLLAQREQRSRGTATQHDSTLDETAEVAVA